VKTLFVFIALLLLSAGAWASEQRYYTLSLNYNAAANTVDIGKTNLFPTVEVGEANQTLDTGTGSQFYAMVFDSRGNALVMPDGSDKYYLGRWTTNIYFDSDTPGFIERAEADVRISVPYFPQGHRIDIHDAKTNALKLSLDVSRFAEARTLAEEEADNPTVVQQKPISGMTWAFIVAGVVAFLGIAIFFYKRRQGGDI